tara:strand:+ start:63 stop:368 length:306 start_codon:yes stop_codon:yes gene_type:complete
MIIKEINNVGFKDEFINYGRADQFTLNGLETLYQFLNESYTDEEPYELDVIGLCVQFTEYESLEDCLQEVGIDDIKTLEDLQNHTIVLEVEESERIIISEF